MSSYKPLDIAQLCGNDEESPYDRPLHPGAARFYAREDILNRISVESEVTNTLE
jgi:hypothetical protein